MPGPKGSASPDRTLQDERRSSAKPEQSIDLADCFVGAIDQGTTSTRFLIFDRAGTPVASHQLEFKQIYPHPGYVEGVRLARPSLSSSSFRFLFS